MGLNLPLAKFQMSYRWDESQHPRDDSGRFSSSGGGHGGAPSFRQRGLREPSPGPGNERRSLTRGETWQRVGAKLPELPIEYTGSRARELPADWFTAPPTINWQIPKDVPVDAHLSTVGNLRRIVKDNRAGAIEKAKVTRQKVAVHGIKDKFTLKRRTGDLILSPDAPRGAVNRAYNHAAMMALHNFGVVDYNFPKMSQAMKDELTPLVPFMRFVHRRLTHQMSTDPETKGKNKAYVAAFGKPFADNRRHKVTGEVRLRLRPNQQFVKGVDMLDLPLAKFDETKHPRDNNGRFAPGMQGDRFGHDGSQTGKNQAKAAQGLSWQNAVVEGVLGGGIAGAVASPIATAAHVWARGDFSAKGPRNNAARILRGNAKVRSVIRQRMKEARHAATDGRTTELAAAAHRKILEEARNGGRDMAQAAIEAEQARERVFRMRGSRGRGAAGQRAAIRALKDSIKIGPTLSFREYIRHVPINPKLLVGGTILGALLGARAGAASWKRTQDIGSGKEDVPKTRLGDTLRSAGAATVGTIAGGIVGLPLAAISPALGVISAGMGGIYGAANVARERNRARQAAKGAGANVKKFADMLDLPLAKRSIHIVDRPTPAQAEAGNYRKAHISIDGLRIAIENPKGSIRRKISKSGKAWAVRMPAHYGYIKRTLGADGDHVDVYLGPKAGEAPQHQVHIIDQVNMHTGAFDEHKAMIGFPTREEAVTTYDAGFSDGNGPKRRGAVTSVSWRTFKRWARTGDTTAPIALTKRAPPGCANEVVGSVMGDVHAILHRAGKAPDGPPGMHPDLAGMMPHIDRLVGPMRRSMTPAPRDRLKTNASVANHKLPLAHLVA